MPSPCRDQDIRISPAEGRSAVTFGGKVIASSTRALSLDEPGVPLRLGIPREGVEAAVLAPSATHGPATGWSRREASLDLPIYFGTIAILPPNR